MKQFVLPFLLWVTYSAITVLFPSFWRSEWGPIVFIVMFWLFTTIAAGQGGARTKFSLRFGIICSTGLAISMLLTVYTNKYVGIAALLLLIYLGVVTKFFARRRDQFDMPSTKVE